MSALQLFHPRQSDTIVSHIKSLVAQGVLRPGDRIPAERDLAQELGLGRGTIREAFHHLEALGLIERKARSRIIRVANPSRSNADGADGADGAATRTLEDERRFIVQIIDVRIGLEGWVAAEVARKASQADLSRLQRILQKLDKGAAAKADLAQLDLEFHRALVEATHNPVVLQMLETLTTMIKSIAAFKKLILDPMRKVDTHLHRQVIEAVVRGDSATAQAAMVAHLEMTRDAISGLRPALGKRRRRE